MSKKNNLELASKLLEENLQLVLTSGPSFQAPTLPEARVRLYYLKAALLSRLVFNRIFPSQATSLMAVLEYFEEHKLMAPSVLKYVEDNLANLGPLCEEWHTLIVTDPSTPSLGHIYQHFLMQNIGIDNGSYYLTNTKLQRDISGSYYTPSELSDKVAQHAFRIHNTKEGIDSASQEIPRRINSQDSLKIADLSCGAGEFLLSAIHAAIEHGSCPKEVINNTWGYDADPIALMIAFGEVVRIGLAYSTDLDIAVIASHFIHGNTLIDNVETHEKGSSEEKFTRFALGRINSSPMGLSREDFPAGGFDLIVGNPPWEKIRFEERKYFASLMPEIAREPNKSKRAQLISLRRINDTQGVLELYDSIRTDYAKAREVLSRKSSFSIPPGELNTYLLFVQLALSHRAKNGIAAQIVRAALVTTATNSEYFKLLLNSGTVEEVHLFNNQKRMFPIDSRERFCVVFLGHSEFGQTMASFGNQRPVTFSRIPTISLTSEDLELVNPLTKMIPDVESTEELEFLLNVQKKFPSFASEYPECHFGRLVHLTNHSAQIERSATESTIGIFEGKFIGPHDLRFSTFEDMQEKDIYSAKARAQKLQELEKEYRAPKPRFYVQKDFWDRISKGYSEPLMICWRSLTSPTNERTMIAALSPFRPASQSVQFLQHSDPLKLLIISGLFNSIPFDGLVRLKMPGIDLTQSIIRQIPVPSWNAYSRIVSFGGMRKTLTEHIVSRIGLLYKNEPEVLQHLPQLKNYTSNRSASRETLREELDELFFHAYDFSTHQKNLLKKKFRTHD